MADLTKIATCCYCGTRAVLRLRGKARHELSCVACGARLLDLKPLVVARPKAKVKPPAEVRVRHKPKPVRKQKRRRDRWRLWDEFWDEVEDFVEDIFD